MTHRRPSNARWPVSAPRRTEVGWRMGAGWLSVVATAALLPGASACKRDGQPAGARVDGSASALQAAGRDASQDALAAGAASGGQSSGASTFDGDSAGAADGGAPFAGAVGIPIAPAEVAQVLNPEGLPAYDGPVGSIEGTVFVFGADPPTRSGLNLAKCPEAVRTRGPLFRAGAKREDGKRPLADAIVGIIGYEGFYLPEKAPVRSLTLTRCEEAPRTIDMTFGQALEIHNRTSLLMAPFFVEALGTSVLAAPPRGAPVRVYTTKPGRFSLADRLGNDDVFGADVYVMLQPLHATTDVRGHFRIDGVPAVPNLQVFARLPAIGKEVSAPITVRAGVVESIELTLPFDGSTPLAGSGVAGPGARPSAGPGAAARVDGGVRASGPTRSSP